MLREIFKKIQENKKRRELDKIEYEQVIQCSCAKMKYRKSVDEIYEKLNALGDNFEEMICLPWMKKWNESDMQLFSDLKNEILRGDSTFLFQARTPWSEKVDTLIDSKQWTEATQLLETERSLWKQNADKLIHQIEEIFSRYKDFSKEYEVH